MNSSIDHRIGSGCLKNTVTTKIGSLSTLNKLLTVCPSRIRPERLMQMFESWETTRSDWNDLVVYVADDDPRLEDYKRVCSGKNLKLVIGKRLTKVGVDNYITTELYPDYEYYSEINDDHIYHTKYWDKILVEEIERRGGWGFACGNKEGLPSGMVISGNIIRTLGYQTTPLLEQTYGDNYHLELGEALGLFYRVEGVDIEHRHHIFGKADLDDNYRAVLSQEALSRGLAGLNEWREKYKQRDIDKIKRAMKPQVGVVIRCYHATQYLAKVLKQYAWVDRVVLLNYRFNSTEYIEDNTKEIFDKFDHPHKVFRSGEKLTQREIFNLGLELTTDCSVVFISDADEFIERQEQRNILNRLQGSDAGCARTSIIDYNGDLHHASPARDHLVVVAVNPKKYHFEHIRSINAGVKTIDCPEIVMQHLGLVFTPEVIGWKAGWEYKEEGHSKERLLKDWSVKREVTPPKWLLEIINE